NLGDAVADPNSLRGAIAATSAGGTVDFAAGLSGTVTLTTAAGGQLSIAKNLTIVGPGASVVTVSGGGNFRVFQITTGTVNISGLVIANGSTGLNGGGIANSGTLNLTNSVLTGNRTGDLGGGVYNSGTLNLTNSTLSGNHADNDLGGGLCNYGT